MSTPLSRLLPRSWHGNPDRFWAIFRPIVQPITLALAPAAAYGVERIPRDRGAVFAANHFSGIDHPLIGCFVPGTTYFLAKSELFEIPLIGDWLEVMGVISIRRGESDRDALRRSREVVRNGHLVCVHIEGTRQRLGYPGPVHTGGLMIAMQEGAPVVPLGLDTFGWSPSNRRNCALVFGEPLELDGLPRNRAGYTEAGELVRAEIVRLWRLAAEAAAAGLPPELPDGTLRNGPVSD
ncbi:MAG TPA: lysophospholipid acyltransferase family protein [Gaiellaceae bacterium]|nr:lysophospholipid acyltransferase family protein [Gaiellaceae bacterium]